MNSGWWRAARVAGVAIVVAGLAAGVGGCQTNAATGESRLSLGHMSREQQIALGAEAQPQLTQEYGGEVANRSVAAYVTEIGEKLAAKTEADNPSLPWEFTLLDSDVINAFALPGGKVFMSRGLAEKMTNEAQLAGVLGHEIGHVTAEHVAERVQAATGVQILGGVLGVIGDGGAIAQMSQAVVGYGGQGYLLQFGRGQELEADRLGMRYMARAGYDPVGQRQVMQILEESMGGARPPEWMSTHPYPESRIEQIDRLLATEYRDVTGKAGVGLFKGRFQREFLSQIAAMPEPLHRSGVVGPAWCAVCNGGSLAAEHP